MGRAGAILCILVVCAVAHADDCLDALVRYNDLTDAQHAALEGVRWTHPVSILEGEVDGIHRTVVIVGESHVQSTAALNATRPLMDAFPQRGIEGYPGSAIWRAVARMAYTIEGVFSGRFGGSSIALAERHARLAAMAQDIVRRYELERKSAEELARFAYRHRGQSYTGHDLLRLRDMPVANVRLENGFVPTMQETFAAWTVPLSALWLRFSALPAVALVGQGVRSGNADSLMAWGALGLASVGAALVNSMLWAPEAGQILLPRRNEHMVQSALGYFRGAPDRRVILVVVGRNHVGGMTDIFGQNGFRNVLWRNPIGDDSAVPGN